MSAQLKAGVIGLGILGDQHVRFLCGQPTIDVTAVADIRADKAEALGAQVGAQPYTDYQRMLNEQRLDIVAIATPDPLHRDPVLAATQAGVPNIILEKPLATTVADAEAMVEAAERAGTRIFINFSNRGSALDLATYYVIKQGLLGEVVYGDVHLDDNIVVPTLMWGERSRQWAAGSSTAHFLLSHVSDYLRWVMAPADVTEVYAIAQRKVLGYTPDLYDAFLTFDNGAKFRVRAEWIKHIDTLVEFKMVFSGSEGGLFYIKRPGFGETEGWRANVTTKVTPEALLAHHQKLLDLGINFRAFFHKPSPTAGELVAGGGEAQAGFETQESLMDWWRIGQGFIDAILEDTLTPSSWTGYGPLPTAIDGLRQTQIVAAIVESAERDQPVNCAA
ncbi:MAG: Gfo/Idh/MocA family oxidoreductase [Anaerolineales bacterium]|nr:Gfo/Idh/MocA family oxidoreductase [Anaerolineales bacterium]